MPNVTVLRNSDDFGFVNNMTHRQLEFVKAMHNENLDMAIELINDGKCDLLIFDEVTYVYDMKLNYADNIDTVSQGFKWFHSK